MPTQRTYYNRFTPQKRWDRILFIPSRELQTAELIEIQAIFDWKLKSLGDVFFSDGVPVNGTAIITPETYPGTLKIEKGYVYINGSIIFTDEVEVLGEFTGEGIEWVYINIVETILEDSDASMRDPAYGEPNYRQYGADRRVISISFTNEENRTQDSFRFDWIRDGEIFFERALFGSDRIIKALEERTFEEMGDFMISGGEITLKEAENEGTGLYSDSYLAILQPYNVYLKGKRYVTLNPQLFEIEKPLETRDIQAFFQIAYHIDIPNDPNDMTTFLLDESYIKKVNTVIYPVRETLLILRGTAGTEDSIGRDSIIEVKSVKSTGPNPITYMHGVDYQVTVAGIDWSNGSPGIEPFPGTQYFVDVVTYRTSNSSPGLEYDTSKFIIEYPDASDGNYQKANLIITDSQYYTGLPEALVNPEYTVYMFKIEAIVIDKLTGIAGLRSSNYEDKEPRIPRIFSDDFLLWVIRPEPGDYYESIAYDIEDERTFRISEKGVREMSNQLLAAQESLTYVELDADAANMPVIGVLEGVYTDLLRTSDRSNVSWEGSGISTPVGDPSEGQNYTTLSNVFPQSFNCSFDNSAITQTILMDSDNKEPSVASNELYSGSKVYTLPFTDVEYITQNIATKTIYLQDYSISEPQPIIMIDPYNDVYLDDQVILIDTEQRTRGTDSKVGRTEGFDLRKNRNIDLAQTELKKAVKSRRTVDRIGHPPIKRGNILGENDDRKPTKMAFTDIASETKTAKTMRQRVITIVGEGWFLAGSLSDYWLKATIGGVTIDNFQYNFTVNSSYGFSGTFTIPEGVPAGNATVKVWAEVKTSGVKVAEAETDYLSDGLIITTTRKIIERGSIVERDDDNRDRFSNKISSISEENVHDIGDGSRIAPMLRAIRNQPRSIKTISEPNFLRKDSIAQTFKVDEDVFITKIGVFFETKGTKSLVECMISTQDNGYPSQNYIATTFLKSSDITTSGNASVETLFEFDHPVYIQGGVEYSIIFRSPNSSSYRLWVATQGETDINTNEIVITQPYDGVFFKSSNGSTYTAFQDTDLKFKIYRASFENTGELIMRGQVVDDSWLLINTRIQEYGSSKLKMYYRILRTTDDNTPLNTWQEYRLGTKQKLTTEGQAQNVQLRFVMESSIDDLESAEDEIVYNDKLTPILSKQIGTLYWTYATKSYYFTPVLQMGDFSAATLIIETVPRNQAFKTVFAVSENEIDWFRYTSDSYPPVVTLIDDTEGIKLYKYKYEFDFSTQYPIFPAKYMMLGIEIGGDEADGSDTPHLMNLRISTYEKI